MGTPVEEGTSENHNHQNDQNWSEQVEDLVASGDSEQARALLESVVLKLETLTPSDTADLLLASALTDLAKLYSSKSFSLKSDELLSRASLLKQRALRYHRHFSAVQNVEDDLRKEDEESSSRVGLYCNDSSVSDDGHGLRSSASTGDAKCHEGTPDDGAAEDDWEAIADRSPNELLSSQCLPGVSNLTLEETKIQTPKRCGRGTFAYTKSELYSERPVDYPLLDDVKTESVWKKFHFILSFLNTAICGTRHVLVLADFSPTLRTIDLEKLFQDFRDCGFIIRWVNDTTALAVFKTHQLAFNSVRWPFTVRILDENDILVSSISSKDLEPPRQRPQTSARTAQRLIAQGMGLKLSSTTFGSRELKTQEEARKNRISTRQKMRHDAWGDE
ncbi:coiled-coil domain-containing protein R3HCC1L isoform X4 [Tripterygium wilfordii]|uniref:Coiled-coil domain-containing protein R3HCC1L isoform X4 n=1 Tax=Tripterygium wilfordii TaxID=458696 RepID=A0A7J7DF67_TRIWF|nr:coiled-coil domain-containing protein R3HCC1L isoform X4 [Tripterygium wilfordii]